MPMYDNDEPKYYFFVAAGYYTNTHTHKHIVNIVY